MEIDRTSPVPVYWQIKENIYRQIIRGQLKTGDRIPSEPKLAEIYGVSRLTARNAVTELVNDGYLFRVHGQGTFVKKPRIESASKKAPSKITGFMEDMEQRGFSVTSKLLIARELSPPDKVREWMDPKREQRVYQVRRLRSVVGEPIVVQDNYLSAARCDGILEEDLEIESIYRMLRGKYRLNLIKVRESLEAVAADMEMSSLLDIEKGAPILYSRRITYIENEEVVEVAFSWHRGDRYVFEVEL